jgi:cytoskeletal protein CcmA (bactofilin family)
MDGDRHEEGLMFGRNTDRDEVRRSTVQTIPSTGLREAATVPVGPGAGTFDVPRAGDTVGSLDASLGADESLVGPEDHFEGKLHSTRGVRVQGKVDGEIESASYVHLEEGSIVSADVTADEVVIAGQYSGKLVCRRRLEIRATGRVTATIETVSLMLHEGGYVDGQLHMQKPEGRTEPAAAPDRLRMAVEPRSGAGGPSSGGTKRDEPVTTPTDSSA